AKWRRSRALLGRARSARASPGGVEAARPMTTPRQVALQQLDVPEVRLPEEVEDVAGKRHRAEAQIERHVPAHARQRRGSHAQAMRLDQDVERDERGRGIAEAGDE